MSKKSKDEIRKVTVPLPVDQWQEIELIAIEQGRFMTHQAAYFVQLGKLAHEAGYRIEGGKLQKYKKL